MSLYGLMSFAMLQGQPAEPQGMFGGGMLQYIILIAMLFLVFYFFVFRPEKKRRTKMQEMINELKNGDKVITIGGIHGTVAGVTEKSVVIRIADQVKIEVTRQAIGTVVKPDGEVVEPK